MEASPRRMASRSCRASLPHRAYGGAAQGCLCNSTSSKYPGWQGIRYEVTRYRFKAVRTRRRDSHQHQLPQRRILQRRRDSCRAAHLTLPVPVVTLASPGHLTITVEAPLRQASRQLSTLGFDPFQSASAEFLKQRATGYGQRASLRR